LKYTVGVWSSPDGTRLLSGGIIPDVMIPFDVTGYVDARIDNQLVEAESLLRSLLP